MKMWLTRIVFLSLALLVGYAIGWQERTKGLAWSRLRSSGRKRTLQFHPALRNGASVQARFCLPFNQAWHLINAKLIVEPLDGIL